MNLKTYFPFSLALFSLVLLFSMPVMADTQTVIGPYKGQKSKILDYEFSYPLNPDLAPVIQVYQKRGLFDTIIRDKDITFKFRYRFECGKGWKLIVTKPPAMEGAYIKDRGKEKGLRKLDITLPGYIPPQGQEPISACNAVIEDRKSAGLPTGQLLKKGFWVTLPEAYPMEMGYRCEEKVGALEFGKVPRFYSPEVAHPLYVQCLGDPDFDKPVAKTSKNTGSRSASRDEIEEALDKKRKKQEAKERAENNANRTNPEPKPGERTNPPGKRTNPEGKGGKDVAYQALFALGTTDQIVSAPRTGADLVSFGESVVQRGFRLVDVETKKLKGKYHYVGLWNNTDGASWFSELKDYGSFDKIRAARQKKGMRLVDIEVVKKENGKRLYSGVWHEGAGNEYISPPLDLATFRRMLKDKKAEGMVAIDFEVERSKDGSLKFHGLWRNQRTVQKIQRLGGWINDVQLSTPIPVKEYRNLREKLEANGQRAIDIERIKTDGKTHVVALWVDGQGKSGFSLQRKRGEFLDFLDKQKGKGLVVSDLEIVKAKK